jgi:hypothetical protein
MYILFNNKVFDGKLLWLYLLIIDVNDFLGCPLIFEIGDYNKFKNFNFSIINTKNWNKKSTKYRLFKTFFEKYYKEFIKQKGKTLKERIDLWNL